jgi:hypothetical protein
MNPDADAAGGGGGGGDAAAWGGGAAAGDSAALAGLALGARGAAGSEALGLAFLGLVAAVLSVMPSVLAPGGGLALLFEPIIA